MKNLLLSLLLIFMYASSFAQIYTLRGKVLSVVDSVAMGGATVLAQNTRYNTMCDQNGYFVLRGIPSKTEYIEISFLGFITNKIELKTNRTDINIGDIYLQQSDNEIDAVVVKSHAPISIQKGDTTQFNAAAFKTAPDSDADELVMKIPGVVIQDGKVEAQGEPIRRIYVDGRLFFGTDPMAALKNLPADAVESIQLFDEQSEQARLTGFDDGESQKAINIVTKAKSKKTTIFKSEASGGAGLDNPDAGRYLVGGNFSHFAEKQRFTVTALSNNVNTRRFGQSDIDANAGMDNNGNKSNQPSGVKKVNGAGLNYSLDNKKIQFSGSYVFDNNNEVSHKESKVSYFAREGKYDSRESYNNSGSNTLSNNHALEFRLEWKASERNMFLLSPRIKVQTSDVESLSTALSIQDGDSLNRNQTASHSDNMNYSISGEAMWTHRFLKKGRSFSTNINYNLSSRSSDRLQRDNYRDSYRRDQKEWTSGTLNNRLYDQLSTGNTMRLKMTYAEPLALYHRILVNYIMTRDWGETGKQANRWDEQTGDYTDKDKRQSSDFERDYNMIGAGLGYSFLQKKYKLSAGLDYQRLEQKRTEYEPNQTQTKAVFFDMQPNVSFRYSLDKSKYLRFRYQGKTILPRLDQMQNVINDNSPSNLRIGNPDLKQGYRHSLTLFYSTSNVAKSNNFTLSMDASTQSDFVASSTEVMPTDRDTVIYVSQGDTEGYTPIRGAFLVKQVNLDGYIAARMSATYSFALRPIKSNINLSVDYGYIRNPSIYTTLNYANLHSGSFRFGVTSNISERVDFNFYSNTAFNYTRNSTQTNTSYINQNLYYSLNVIFWHNFVLNSLFTWKYYTSGGTSDFSSSYYLWNVGIGKKLFKRNKGEFRITAYDLLNQNRNLQHYVRDNATEDARTNTIGRYIMARLSYRFNSLNTNARKKAVAMGDNVKNIDVKTLKKMSKKEIQ